MDSSDVTQLIILIILLILSAFFSSAETALTTVNKIRIRSLADEGNKRAKSVLKVTDDSGKMLSAILIGNNIVNLSAASLTTSLAYSFGGSMVAIASGILTVLILLFGEITPKTMATIHSEKMSLLYAPVIHFFMYGLNSSQKCNWSVTITQISSIQIISKIIFCLLFFLKFHLFSSLSSSHPHGTILLLLANCNLTKNKR